MGTTSCQRGKQAESCAWRGGKSSVYETGFTTSSDLGCIFLFFCVMFVILDFVFWSFAFGLLGVQVGCVVLCGCLFFFFSF